MHNENKTKILSILMTKIKLKIIFTSLKCDRSKTGFCQKLNQTGGEIHA